MASALVLALFTATLLFWLYPGPLLSLQGGGSVLALLLTVDVLLGPTLTALVFKPDKKHLAIDLSIIVAVQLVALGYGMTTLYVQRPNCLVFVLDRFFLVSAMDTVGELPTQHSFTNWRGGVSLASGVVTPLTTPESLDGLMSNSGDNLIPPLAIMAADLTPYPAPGNRPTASLAIPFERLGPAERKQVLSALKTSAFDPEHTGIFPVIGRKATAIALVNLADGHLLTMMGPVPLPNSAEPSQ